MGSRKGHLVRSLLVALLALSAGDAAADDLRVFATGVFATSLRDLQEPFEAAGGSHLRITLGNAGEVNARIIGGEPADVVMTSAAALDALAKRGKIDAASKVEIGRMRLGVGVRADAPLPDVSSPDRLRALLLAATAVAYIDPHGGATAGMFFERIFVDLGIGEAVHAKAVLCADGAQVVAALSSGRASVGMTQASEIRGAPGAAFAGFLPDPLNTATPYAAAAATATPAALAFLRFMQGPRAAERLRQAGWDLNAT